MPGRRKDSLRPGEAVDLSIAKFQRGGANARGTTPGMIVGTMQYMAPEQLEGAEAEPRVDVYALGLILVEMLTGRLPWGQSNERTLNQFTLRLVVPPTPLPQLRPEQPFSAELVKLVEDMLALDPNKRPLNGGELFHRLRYIPEAPASLRRDGSSDRASSSGIQRFTQPGLLPSPAAAASKTEPPAASRPPFVRYRALVLAAGLVLLVGLVAAYLTGHRDRGASGVGTGSADKPPPPPVPAKPSPPPPVPEKLTDANSGTGKAPAHRLAHTGGTLRVQFAFTEAQGVTLTCGGKRQPPPECAGAGICKAVAQVAPGQKCTAEKGSAKVQFTYSDLQKNPADRKNLIHILVRFP